MPATCTTCDDTHRMDLADSVVMCTRCPVPCRVCQGPRQSPYCETTPCACGCHNKDKGACRLCGKDLGRQIGAGSHYNCRVVVDHALAAIGSCFREIGMLERAFRLGSFAGIYEADSWHRPMPWHPGHGLSADHDCTDCGTPLLTDDVARGFMTCDSCAEARRDAR